MFTLPRTESTLVSKTDRAEKHGPEDVPALSAGMRIAGANCLFDSFTPPESPTLREVFYELPPGALPSIPEAWTKLRMEGIDCVIGAGELVGWTVTIEHGINAEAPIVLKDCKLDNFRFFPKKGGQMEATFRIGTSAVDARIMGLLGMKIGQKVHITIEPPEVADDGKKAKEAKKAQAKQRKLEADGQQRIDAETPESALAKAVGAGAAPH